MVRSIGGMLSKRYSEQSIDNLDRWIEVGMGGSYSGSGTYIEGKSAFRVPAAYACIDLLGRAASILPGFVYERLEEGIRDRRKDTRHYLHPIIHRRANPMLPANQWRRRAVTDILGWGNHYSWIEWDRRPIPRYLWPLPPDKVKVERTGAIDSPVRYYVWERSGWVEFPAEDILHISEIGDGVIGWSPVQLMCETFGLAMAQQNSAASMHKNGISSRLVLEYAGTATPDQIKALRESFQEANAGYQNQHKAIVLQAGFTAKPISINPRDAQFLEQAQYTDAKIYQIYGTPPHMVGDTEKATSWGTGIEQQTIGYIVYRLLPMMNAIESAIELKLLPDNTRFFTEYEFKGLLRGDTTARAAWHRAMIELGVSSPNDVRRAENEEPYEGGSVYRRPLNTAFVDDDGNVVAFTPPGGSAQEAPNETAPAA